MQVFATRDDVHPGDDPINNDPSTQRAVMARALRPNKGGLKSARPRSEGGHADHPVGSWDSGYAARGRGAIRALPAEPIGLAVLRRGCDCSRCGGNRTRAILGVRRSAALLPWLWLPGVSVLPAATSILPATTAGAGGIPLAAATAGIAPVTGPAYVLHAARIAGRAPAGPQASRLW
jgi:hypothetical protein